ncbi:MAG: hypothetical protein Q8P56_03505 [Candidatus Uhrbacteria bacterium]|nr:hypothetical protein [Candidatus Uhrbacteria bacterium]
MSVYKFRVKNWGALLYAGRPRNGSNRDYIARAECYFAHSQVDLEILEIAMVSDGNRLHSEILANLGHAYLLVLVLENIVECTISEGDKEQIKEANGVVQYY